MKKEHDGTCHYEDGFLVIDPNCKFHHPETRATIDPNPTPTREETIKNLLIIINAELERYGVKIEYEKERIIIIQDGKIQSKLDELIK